MADNQLLRAALDYVGRKWLVFPIWWISKGRCACGKADCSHPGKHPVGKLAPKGRNSATTDPKIIREWWRQYPKANIGLPTGSESGLVVVDIDPRNGGDRGELERLGDFPQTPTACTGGGGEHILLRHPGRKIKSKHRLGGLSGIDQKGDGGYIVAPPSNHISGGVYSWKIGPDTPLAEIPEWLVPLLLQGEAQAQAHSPERRQGHHQGGGGAPGGDYEAYASKALAEELADLARTPEGNRNARLNQASFCLGQLVGAGVLDRGQVEAALLGVALSIGLGEVEARATIKSGLDSGIKEPRALPKKGHQAARRGGGGPRQGKSPGSPEKAPPASPGESEAERIWWVGHCYFKEKGRLCLEVYDRQGMPQTRPLANFQARIEEEISRDDGLRVSKEFHLTGSLDTGRPLPPALVPSEKFDSLSWVKPNWGAAAAVNPGRSLGPHLANAIQAFSQGHKRRRFHAHTGWRLVGGVWRYLHGGGAIGQGEDLEVDLGENLGNYRLPSPGGLEAAQASLRFMEVGPWEITAPLLACVYLAPFADLLKIDFSLWLYGPTGGFKSTLAALALSHFGAFDRLNLPGSWFSTVNSLEKLCFILKDSLIVIDDFCPAASARDFHNMTEKAGRLLYQVGNKSGRGRLAPDLKARPSYRPRGLIISTGEVLLPGQRQSATARYLGVELDPKKTPIDLARLTAAQEEAHLYAGAMAAYLEELAPRLEETQEELRDLWESYRIAFRGTAHLRVPEILAWLAVGFEYALRFFARLGAISQDQADQMLKRAWGGFAALGEVHARRIEGERPTLKFIAVLRELFYTGRIFAESVNLAGVAPPEGEVLGWAGSEPKAKNAFPVGWADENILYLLPETAYRVVQEAIRAQGDYLALGKNDLLASLAREGFIEPGKEGKNSQVKWMQGGARRVVCLPLVNLAHDEVADEEQK